MGRGRERKGRGGRERRGEEREGEMERNERDGTTPIKKLVTGLHPSKKLHQNLSRTNIQMAGGAYEHSFVIQTNDSL